MTLSDFLLARIAEDEAGAAELVTDPRMPQVRYEVSDSDGWRPLPWRAADHRMLAECEAKRRIVALHDHPEGMCWEMHRGVYGPGWPEGSYAVEGEPWAHPSLEGQDVHPGPCETLQLLALPYADHPDYRDEWRP